MKRDSGFTLMEIVLVLVLIGVVSITVAPKIVPMVISTSTLEEAKLEVIGRVVHARNRAMLLAPSVKPTITCTDVGLVYKEKASITVPLTNAKVTCNPLKFEQYGVIAQPSTITVSTLDGTESVRLTIEQSGFVHE